MPPTLQKVIITALALSILVHQPTFERLINILVNTHIFLRIAFSIARSFIEVHFPTLATWAVATFHDVRAYLMSQYRLAFETLAPMLHHAMMKMVELATTWLRKSPIWLCETNRWVLGAGERMERTIGSGERDGEILENWLRAGEYVARFCARVSDLG
ncbi:hypothetical protein BDW02DRAFT_603330 [Decorospora gaudefroyi]|uniref:Uncharacterized protein n=1 Tax=Decorospora gaudefroyi TaxID=184978 RepID=A0A6A5JY49_9PLEO|nr:hypothetical protein BDW02DRAFT_603330 [Decorospora gaudefroyi]